MAGDGSVLSELRQIIEGKPRCGITDSIRHRGSGNKLIGFRGVLQVNPEERQQFVFTGFSYLPDEPETIGVMQKLVKMAADQDRLILVYYQDHPFYRSMVFHPTAYERVGEPETKAAERQKRGERWLNLPRQYSCSLRELADREAEPRTEELPRGTDGGQGWFDA
jgi:hypothetical protein